MFLFFSMYVLSLVFFFFHWLRLNHEKRNLSKAIELLLLYQLVFSVGMTSFLAFIGLTFIPEYVAAFVGWPVCPFQQELANVNLAFGILGILCIWLRDNFWTATVFGFSIWIFADGLHHILDIVKNGNIAPGSAGGLLITDLAVPMILVILWVFWKKRG